MSRSRRTRRVLGAFGGSSPFRIVPVLVVIVVLLALPVILAPGRDYVLPINSGGAGGDEGFRASDDTPAEPYELRFRTSVEVPEAIADDGTEQANEAAP